VVTRNCQIRVPKGRIDPSSLTPALRPADAGTMAEGAPVNGSRRVDGFDGLRACAALMVITYHAGLITGASKVGALAAVVSELKAGVAVFFVISGFLLYLPSARAIREDRSPQDWRGYAARRAARILPGYWVALTVLVAAGQVTGVVGPDWWRFYGLVQIYQNQTLFQGLGPAWSLCVEVSFYLALPLLAVGMHRLVARRSGAAVFRAQLLAFGVVVLWSLGLRAAITHSLVLSVPLGHFSLATSIAGTADWFAAGMALAVVRVEWERGASATRWLMGLAARPGRCWLLAAVAYLIGVPLQHGELFLPLYGVATHVAIGLAAALFVLPAVRPVERHQATVITRVLNGRQLAWLGTISYGMYIWHVPFLRAMDQLLGDPRGAAAFVGMFFLAVVGAICLGAASWYLVERPSQSWVKRRSGATAHATPAVAAGP
jgi:peptidoglycan/LPS O-acetylase OafA/YrhL